MLRKLYEWLSQPLARYETNGFGPAPTRFAALLAVILAIALAVLAIALFGTVR